MSRVWLAVVLTGAIVLGRASSARCERAADSPALQAALAGAVTVENARVDIVALDLPRAAGNCAATGPNARVETARPIDGSGRFALKLTGTRVGGGACEVWAWVQVRVFAKVPVAGRALRAGEPLSAAAKTDDREIKSGHVPATWDSVVADGSVAAHALGAGQLIETDAVRPAGLKAGESVKILIVSGALAIEQIGHAIPCGRGKTCALLPSGKHIEGTLVDGRLMVQLP